MNSLFTPVDMIDVFISNGKAYVWCATDVAELREKYRIVGTLVGCLPRLPRQNVYLGLPLQLLPEEVAVLLDTDVIRLKHNSAANGEFTESEIQAFKKEREQLYKKQVELCREEALHRAKCNLPTILEGMKAKRRKEIEHRKACGEDISDSELEKIDFDIDSMEIAPLPEKHSCVQIPTVCTQQKDYSEADWTFPATPSEILRYRIYKDLYEKGYWLTSGGKFGGDFLVYPGDPMRYHSFYIAVCVSHNKKIPLLEITAYSRLGANVKKTVVLCSVNDSDEVTYTSLQWTGIT